MDPSRRRGRIKPILGRNIDHYWWSVTGTGEWWIGKETGRSAAVIDTRCCVAVASVGFGATAQVSATVVSRTFSPVDRTITRTADLFKTLLHTRGKISNGTQPLWSASNRVAMAKPSGVATATTAVLTVLTGSVGIYQRIAWSRRKGKGTFQGFANCRAIPDIILADTLCFWRVLSGTFGLPKHTDYTCICRGARCARRRDFAFKKDALFEDFRTQRYAILCPPGERSPNIWRRTFALKFSKTGFKVFCRRRFFVPMVMITSENSWKKHSKNRHERQKRRANHGAISLIRSSLVRCKGRVRKKKENQEYVDTAAVEKVSFVEMNLIYLFSRDCRFAVTHGGGHFSTGSHLCACTRGC